MYEKLDVPKGAPLFQTSTLDTMAVLSDKQRTEFLSFPQKLREMFMEQGLGQIVLEDRAHTYISRNLNLDNKMTWKCTSKKMYPANSSKDKVGRKCANEDEGTCILL